MKLYKLINGQLQSAPNQLEIIVNGKINGIVNPEPKVLIAEGYKPLIEVKRPSIEWFEKHVVTYNEDSESITEVVTVDAIIGLNSIYQQRILNELNRALENDFIWAGNVVKMSESNQKDYLASFSLSTFNPEFFIPMEYTFKDNVKYIMTTIDEVVEFSIKGLQFVNQQLEKYRSESDKIKTMTNEELYNHIKTL